MSLKIIFINPPLSQEERLGAFANAGNIMPFLGMIYLAGMTRDKGYETKIIDSSAENMDTEQILERITEEKPDVVGISASTVTILKAEHLLDEIKKIDSSIITILGGPHITAIPTETMNRLKGIDIGVLGEGEHTIVEILQSIETNSGLSEVKGIIYRIDEGLKTTPPRPLLDNLDELPTPAWDLLPKLDKYKSIGYNLNIRKVGSIITSRGCPFDCKFCDHSVFGRKVRYHTNEYVIKMIKLLYYDYEVRELEIYDDMFTVDRNRVTELCQMIIKENMDLIWSCNVRVDSVDKDLLRLFKEAGCYKVNFGIESGSKRILKLINKKINLDRVREVIGWASDVGLVTRGYFIMGFPYETIEDMKKTLKFAKSLDIRDFQLTYLTPFPGTKIYNDAKQTGTFDDDWAKMSYMHLVYTPEGITNKQMKRMITISRIQFYFRPKVIKMYLKEIKSTKDFFKAVRVASSLVTSYFKRY